MEGKPFDGSLSPLDIKNGLNRRKALKTFAAAAVVAGTAGCAPGKNNAQPPNQPEALPTNAPATTAIPREITPQAESQLLNGKDYSLLVNPKVIEVHKMTGASFLNLKAQAEILTPDPAICHPRVNSKGQDAYYDWSTWAELSTPAQNVIEVKKGQKESPVRLFGLAEFMDVKKDSLIVLIPESTLSPYLPKIDGMNIYYEASMPNGPQLRPINLNTEGPIVQLVDITTVGLINEGVVRGATITPGKYYVINFTTDIDIQPDRKPELKQGVKIIFWEKETDSVKNNPKLLSIQL